MAGLLLRMLWYEFEQVDKFAQVGGVDVGGNERRQRKRKMEVGATDRPETGGGDYKFAQVLDVD